MTSDPAPDPCLPGGATGEVLVTGGAGFIGSHLTALLLARGHAVHVVDDLSSGAPANLAAVHGHPRLRVTIGSIADPELAMAACRAASCVFHLAGSVGVRLLAEQPLAVMERNLRCTEVVLRAAAAACRPILLASSSEVYGDGPVPFVEHASVRPGATEGLRGGYACAKAMGEWLALGHAHEHGLPVVIARLFNTVGPRQTGRYGMVLPRFVQQALRGEPLTVYGTGAQTRCFAHVEEVVAALVALLATPAARGRVVNVGSEQEVSVHRLARLVAQAARRVLGSEPDIVQLPLESVFPAGFVDPPRRVPSLDRLRAAIGCVPSRPIEAIVDELVTHAAAAHAVPA